MTTKKFLLGFAVFVRILYSHAFIRCHSTTRQARQRNGYLPSVLLCVEGHSPTTGEKDEKNFMEKLSDRLRRNDTVPVVVEGYVTSKRSIGKNLAFLDFQVNHDTGQRLENDHDVCQALLRKDVYTGDYHGGYRRCLLKGCKFRLTGVASPTRIPGNVVLMLHSMELLALPRQPQHIQIILQQALDEAIPFKEVVRACSAAQHNAIDNSNLMDLEMRLLSLKEEQSNNAAIIQSEIVDDHNSMIEMEKRNTISQSLKTLARDILNALPDDPQYPVAADEKTISKEGNFIKPLAPREWQVVPKQIGGVIGNSKDDLTTTSGVKETLTEMMSVVRSGDIQMEKTTRASITGWVQNRRRFKGNITMIYIVDDLNRSSENKDHSEDNLLIDSLDRLACLVHPDVLCGKNRSGIYQNLIGSGSKVKVEGHFLLSSTTRANGNDYDEGKNEIMPMPPLLLWVQNIRLVRSSYRSTNIRHLLDLLYQKQFNPKEASESLMISHEEANKLSFQSDATQRQWKANLLAVRLQKKASSENSSMRRIDPALLNVMEKYRHLSKIHPVIATSIGEGKVDVDYYNKGEMNRINPFSLIANANSNDNDNLKFEKRKRKTVPIGMPGSKWQTKKRPQLEWMGQQIRDVLVSHPDFMKRKLTILDIGGGKGALANYLGRKMGDHIQVHVVDISLGALNNGRKKAERLDLPVDFQFADASNSNLLDAVDADVVVALHACGHLSDVALNHAIYRQAGFVIVPCCFNSNPHLMIPGNEGGSCKNTNLTPVSDWLGLPTGDWSALKLLAEVQDDVPLASEVIGIICAIRAEAAKKKSLVAINKKEDDNDSTGNLNLDRAIEIKSFPIQYSTRNTVLVGKCA